MSGVSDVDAAREALLAGFAMEEPPGVARLLVERFEAALRASTGTPWDEPFLERVASAIAYAMARTDPVRVTETGRMYAERLAPLVIESRWLDPDPPAEYARLAESGS